MSSLYTHSVLQDFEHILYNNTCQWAAYSMPVTDCPKCLTFYASQQACELGAIIPILQKEQTEAQGY